jgi:hypothetical protein
VPRRPKSSSEPAPPSVDEKVDRRLKNPGLGFGLRNPQTSEVAYDKDELEFIQAIDEYKRKRQRNFPTWREVFHVFKSLGYRKERVPRVVVDVEALDEPDPE